MLRSLGSLLAAAALSASAHAQSVEFRIVERTGQTQVVGGMGGGGGDTDLDFAVQARVIGGTPAHALGGFGFDIVLTGESDAWGTLNRGRISNPDHTYATTFAVSSAVGIGGLAVQYTYLAGLSAAFNGVINLSTGSFTNTPQNQEIGLVTGFTFGAPMLATPGFDPGGEGNPATWSQYGTGATPSSGDTAAIDAATGATYFALGQFVDVYRFRYTVTDFTSRRISATIVHPTAQVFPRFIYSNGAWNTQTSALDPVQITVTGVTVDVGSSGSCCAAATGQCEVVFQVACTSGMFTEGGVCSPNPCPAPQGQCCNGGGVGWGWRGRLHHHDAHELPAGQHLDPHLLQRLNRCVHHDHPARMRCGQRLDDRRDLYAQSLPTTAAGRVLQCLRGRVHPDGAGRVPDRQQLDDRRNLLSQSLCAAAGRMLPNRYRGMHYHDRGRLCHRVRLASRGRLLADHLPSADRVVLSQHARKLLRAAPVRVRRGTHLDIGGFVHGEPMSPDRRVLQLLHRSMQRAVAYLVQRLREHLGPRRRLRSQPLPAHGHLLQSCQRSLHPDHPGSMRQRPRLHLRCILLPESLPATQRRMLPHGYRRVCRATPGPLRGRLRLLEARPHLHAQPLRTAAGSML